MITGLLVTLGIGASFLAMAAVIIRLTAPRRIRTAQGPDLKAHIVLLHSYMRHVEQEVREIESELEEQHLA